MLKTRLLTALWGTPLVIAAAWFDGPLPWFTVFTVVLGLLAIYEFYKLTGVFRFAPLAAFGIIWTAALIVIPHCTYELSLLVWLASGVVLSLVLLLFFQDKTGIRHGWVWMFGGILYIGLLLGILVTLRLEAGREWLFLALFAAFGSDTFAYFTGKSVGRHKLAPRVSPGKTWEGAVGGLAGAVLVVWLFTLDHGLQVALSVWQSVVLGLLVSVFGQLGDLAESFLKRRFGVKDAGRLIPGHGGVLDRIDSIVFAGVVVYIFYLVAG